MQSYTLTLDKFLDHGAKWSGGREIVTAMAGAPSLRIGYAGLRARSNRFSGALASLGLRAGDTVGTLAWNSQHHLETIYAAVGAGMICHTLNPRLTPAQLAAMVEEGGARVLAAASSLAPLLADLAPLCKQVEHVILMDGAADAPAPLAGGDATIWAHEALLDQRGAPAAWGAFAEESAAGLCYTSGTTGPPKGVLYTHRSNYLHTIRLLQADAMALTGRDCLLLAVPMFHANGWGLPFAAPATGAKLVLPGRELDGASLAALMRQEEVSVAAGVQTVWVGLLDHLDAAGGEIPSLRRLIIGGSSCPEALIARMEQRLGVRVQTSWGMTELSPLGTIAPADGVETARGSGRPPMGLDLKLTDADGVTLPSQRGKAGHLKVRGASVLQRYFKAASDALDEEGYFDTGDLAVIDEAGALTITGRAKDLIKSGGEWINPAEIEEIAGRHEAVDLAAVIGRPDPKWGERPVLIVQMRPGFALDGAALLDHLRGKVADWWLPGQVLAIPAMPLAATGKIDKRKLRAEFAGGDGGDGGSSA